MNPMVGRLVVEGHGEVAAAGNLVNRLWADLRLDHLAWTNPARWPGIAKRERLERACRAMSVADTEALLIMRDEDDGCPRRSAPEAASWLAELRLPFPSAIVLLHREYEVLFLPCVASMAGKPLQGSAGVVREGLLASATFAGDPEQIRDVKGWLSERFRQGRVYKPSVDQLPMTRMLDFGALRASALPCFGSLERALRFLSSQRGKAGAVYPSAEGSNR